MNEGTCRSCGAKMRWVKMKATGKANPLDAEPSEKGNVHIDDAGEGTVLSRDVIAKMRERLPASPLYLSHFATCPGAAQFKKPKAS